MADISAIKLPDNTTYDIKDNISGYATEDQVATKANLVIAYVDPNIADNTSTTLYKDIWCEEAYTYNDIWYNDKVRETDDNNYRLMFIGFTDGDGDADFHLYVISFKNWNFTLYQVDGLSSFYAYMWIAGWSGNAVFTYHALGNTISYNDLDNKPTIPTKTSDLTNDSGFVTTDNKVLQETVSNDASYPVLLGYQVGVTNTTSKVHKSFSNFSFNPSTGSLKANKFNGLTLNSLATGFNISGGDTSKTLTINESYTLAGACAKAVDNSISTSSSSSNLPTSAAVASFVEGKGYITSYTETDPVFSASAAAGITSTDISNWNNKVSDDHKWNDVSLTKSATSITSDVYVPCMLSTSATSAELLSVLDGATTAYSLVRRNGSGYIKAATPPANDNSTYVATTAWVKSALPTKTSDLTNDSDFITSSDLPDLSNYVQNHYSDSVNSYILPWTSEGAGYIQYRVSYSDNTESSTNIAYGVDTQRNSWIGLGADSLHFVGNIKLQTENDPNNSIYLTIPTLSSDVTLTLPNTTGTLALTSNIPTKTSDLTNDSGFVTTDEKVKTINVGDNTNYYLVMGSRTGTETKMTSKGLYYKENSSDHISTLTIGYPMTSGHLTGNIVLAKDNNYYTTIVPSTTGTHNTLTLPNTTGTLALTSNIPTKTSDLTNDSGFVTTDTNTTYTLSNALSSHKFTSTLTAGGSGSGTSTATMEFVAGTGITLTDDTTNKKITIASSVVNTDEKLKVTTISATGSQNFFVLSGNSDNSENKKRSTSALSYYLTSDNKSILAMGASNIMGQIQLIYGDSGGHKVTIQPSSTTGGGDKTITFPDATGTVALTSDIPPIPLIPTDLSDLNNDLNVSDFPNDAGYITGYTETDPIFTASAAYSISASDITNWNSKQAALVSGTNIKTINSQSLLGSGDITTQTIYASTVAPTSADGIDGDVWFIYTPSA